MSSNMNNEDRESTTSEDYAKPPKLTSSAATRKSCKNETTYDESEKSNEQSTTKSDNQQESSTPPIGTGKAYTGGGLKNTFHGVSYQMKLTMLYAIRGLKKGCEFQVATEIEVADKLDDILFLHEKDEIAFFQAKHRLNEDYKITEERLLSDEGDFSIPKYFNSYNKILNEKELKDYIKGRKMILVLNTNIDIDKSILEKSFEPVAASSILALGTKEEQKNCYSIRKESDLYGKLLKIQTMLEPTKRVAEQLAIEVANYKNKCISTKNLLDGHRDWLLANVLEVSKEHIKTETKYFVTFRDSFLNGSEQNESNFQEIFYNKYLEQTKQTDPTSIQKDLLGVKFQVPRSFASPKNSEVKNVQDSPCTLSLMRTFLDKLVFAVKQPNEIELGDLVEKEISNMGYGDAKSIASKFKLYIQDWAKQREGRYLKNEDVERQLAIWGYETISESKMEDIKKYKCVFKKSNEVIVSLSNFLNTKQHAHTVHDVLYLYCTDTLFSKIKVCQVFETFSQENINQQYIFCDIGDLIEFKNRKKCLVKAFSSQTCNTLFVSLQDCELNDAEVQMLSRLLKIITESNYNVEQPPSNKQRKRLIMAIPEYLKSKFTNNNFCNNQDFKTIKSLPLNDLSNSFKDLDEITRRHLINNGSIKFNGHQVTNLLSENELDLCIKDEMLLKLVSNELEINEAVERNQYNEEVKRYYAPRSLLPVIVNPHIKEDSQFYIVQEYITHDIGNKEVVVISSDEKVFEEFRKTCTNVHWLQEINKKYVWMNSKGILTNLRKYVAEQYSDSDASIPVKNVSNVKNDIVLINANPGMGKSILLSHIAEQSKNENNSFVVCKTNLTRTIDKLESLNAEENTTLEQALHFLFVSTQIESSEIEESESAFHLLTLPRDKYGNVTFLPNAKFGPFEHLRAMVFCHLYNKKKIVLFLDGFDEIAPDYCKTTLNLLLTLKQSKVRKMWITSRPYAITKDLENCLNTFAYALKPLSKNEQLIFFEIFRKHNIKSRYIETQSSPEDFLKSLDMSAFSILNMTDEESGSFMGVPLHCYMVAKVFAKDFCSQNFIDAPGATLISVCDLYSKMFDIKFEEILHGEVNLKYPKNESLRKEKKMVESDLGKLALLVMFEKTLPSELVSNEERIALINSVKSGKEKTGFVSEVVGNIPQFVHRTYAEYFAAHYLANVLMSPEENETKKEAAKSLLYENLTTTYAEKCRVLFTFFNSIVVSRSKNRDIFEAAIQGNIEKLSEIENVNEIFDPLKRTPMHLIAIDLPYVLVKFLGHFLSPDLEIVATKLNCFKNIIQRLCHSMSKCSPDALFTWTPAHYLTQSFRERSKSCDEMSPCLVYYLSDITPDTLYRTPLMLLILRNSCIPNAMKNYALLNRIDVNAQDKFGKTALHYALEKHYDYWKDKLTDVCLLLKLGARIDIPDNTDTRSEDHLNDLLTSMRQRNWSYNYSLDLPSCSNDDTFKKSWNHVNKHVRKYMCAYDDPKHGSEKLSLIKTLYSILNISNNTPSLPYPNSQVIALYYMGMYNHKTDQNLITKLDIFTLSVLNEDEIIFLLTGPCNVAPILLSKFPHLAGVVDSRGRSALHYAIFNKSKTLVTLLIESNTPVDIPDSYGKIPAYIEKSNVLLKCDTFDKTKLNFINSLPLEVAEPLVLTMNLYPIRSQTDADFIIHILLLDTKTIANILLSHYPNAVDAKDSKGRTALHFAVENKNRKTISYLISKNAEVDIVDNEGKLYDKLTFIDTLPFLVAKPLVLALGLVPPLRPFDHDLLKYILDKHRVIASILWAEYSDLLVKHNCIYFWSVKVSNEIVSRLLNIYCIEDFSVHIVKSNRILQLVLELFSSVKSNDLSRVQRVLEYVKSYNPGKYKTLNRKVYLQNTEIGVWDFKPELIQFCHSTEYPLLRSTVSMLCNKTNVAISIVNARSDKDGGKSALHYAAEIGNADIVEALLSHGAYYNVSDFHGSTPLQIAETQRHSVVVGLMVGVEKLLNSLIYEHFKNYTVSYLTSCFSFKNSPKTIEDKFLDKSAIQNLGIEFADNSSDDLCSIIMKIQKMMMDKTKKKNTKFFIL